jgi:subtilisin family serine protease
VKRIGLWSLTALAVVACSDANSPSGPTRLAPYVESNGDLTSQVVPGEYIVVLNDNVGDVMGASVASGAEVMATWDKALRGYAVRATPEQVRAIRADARVKFVEPNGRVSITATQTPTPSWGLDRIDQANLPLNSSYTYPSLAAGVHVYTIDTGILLTHNDFAGRMSTGFDAITTGGNANDCHGHGTHVSGTIGGTIYGVAKGVTFHPVRVLNCSGSGTNTQVINGINWVAANKIQPAVANMSLGGSFSAALNTASNNLVIAGVVLAVASGNSSADACSFSPASADSAISVNAATITDARASFSNFGTCTDIFAPGNNIVSDYIGSNSATATLSGTSMASPHVAGAAALYRSANPGHTPAQVKAALLAGATLNKITNPGAGSPNRNLNIQFIGGGGGNQAPVADFTITCTPGANCIANASPSTDDGGFGNLTFAWTNNVGRPAKTGNPAQYNYNVTTPAKNTFNLTLTVTDAGGLTHSITKAVVIPAAGGNQAPVADFTITCTAGVNCVLDASTSTDDGGLGNLTFAWANNVGRPAKTGNPATYNYNATTPAKNTFNATLTVTDAGGLTSSITKAVVIP